MKSEWRRYGFSKIGAEKADSGSMTIEMTAHDGQRVVMHVWPHEARLIADMIYKVSTEGEMDE